MTVAEPAAVPCRLYLITPERLDPDSFAPLLQAALDAGDIACVQLRLKGVEDDVIRRAAARLLPVTSARNVALLLNDRPDLARETGCDGVHIGQTDGTFAEARRLLGPDRIVGVTCHADRDLAMDAAEAGADYVAFGAFFPSTTKEVTHHADIDLLEWWSEIMTVPCVAIGGITPDNCPPLVAAGADFLAVSASVWNHTESPAAAIKAFGLMMDRARIT